MFRQRVVILFVIIIALLSGAALPGRVGAQDGPSVRFVPIMGEIPIAKLSPDGRTLAVFDNFQVHNSYEVFPEHLPIQLVDLDSGKVSWLVDFRDWTTSVVFSDDGARIVSTHANGDVFVWDPATHNALSQMRVFPNTRAYGLLANNQTMIANSSTTFTQITQWDLTTGYMTALLMPDYATYAELQAQFANGLPDSTISLDVAPDGQSLAAVTSFGRIWRWDLTTHEPTLLVDTENTLPMFTIRNVTYTADGSTLVYVDGNEGIVHFIDAATGAEQQTVETGSRSEIALAPDGSRFFWVDLDNGVIKQWEAGTITDLMPVPTPPNEDLTATSPSPTPSLFLTPDGTRLVFTGYQALGDGVNTLAIIDLE